MHFCIADTSEECNAVVVTYIPASNCTTCKSFAKLSSIEWPLENLEHTKDLANM